MNLNSFTTNIKPINCVNFSKKMSNLLKACMEYKTDIKRVFLSNEDLRFARSLYELQYFEAKFNDLGITLVFPESQERLQ